MAGAAEVTSDSLRMNLLEIKHKPSIALALIYGVLALGTLQSYKLFGFKLFTS